MTSVPPECRVDGPMASADAMWLWFSARFPTDQALVFAFRGVPASVPEAVAATLTRAREIPYLAVRIREDPAGWRHPTWVPAAVAPEQAVVHELPTSTWDACLDAVSAVLRQQLDPRVRAWRLHVFTPVHGVPGTSGAATVVVLQIDHTLGGGGRTAALAGALFGRSALPDPIQRATSVRPLRSVTAKARAKRTLAADTAAGRLPAVKAPVRSLSVNATPSGTRVLRTLTCDRDRLSGPTVTVGAMTAISDAMTGYLTARGEDPAQLTAAVPVAKRGVAKSYNHFDQTWIGFHPDAPTRDEQIRRITDDFAAWHRRTQHPSYDIASAPSEAIPAAVRRLAIKLARIDGGRELVPAHTTVSSVDRGPADLSFGGCSVAFTTGFPALVPISSLSHGVHVIGRTVAIGVHASAPQVDVDDYLDRLDAALTR